MSWSPSIGAWPERDGVRFRVWAPTVTTVQLQIEQPDKAPLIRTLDRTGEGYHETWVAEAGAGTRYWYRLDGRDPLPDPASRSQPDGVHGSSEVVDPAAFAWSDNEPRWRTPALADLVVYELHVGTFSEAGTFEGIIPHLPALAGLGVTAIELMPVAEFAGSRNWGYDGVDLFAPDHDYGTPNDLRRLVDAAHQAGLAVLLDVVYNHLGPDGAYLGTFSPHYFTNRHQSPWGAGVNLDGEHSGPVRSFFIENTLHWLQEYHVDGVRLDATHALMDDGPVHFLAELTTRVREAMGDRQVLLIAEDSRNLAHMAKPVAEGGWGLDAVWADDLHHQVRRLVAGDSDGYYQDFTGSVTDLAQTIADGWFFRGQYSDYLGHPRGTDPTGLAPRRFVVCIQNHDQVGNRAFGDRLNQAIAPEVFRTISTLLLFAPETPLLFMGQEWAATTPFLYFTEHHEELGRLVTEGRRNEFRRFARFADPAHAAKIPDPQAPETFAASRLQWAERDQEPHASTLRLYQRLLELRRQEPALQDDDRSRVTVTPLEPDMLLLRRQAADGSGLLAVFRFRGSGEVEIRAHLTATGRADDHPIWVPVLTTEDPAFAPDATPVMVEIADQTLTVDFPRPGAIVFRTGATVVRNEE